MVCSEGLSSRQSQAKRGLAAWTIIMGCGPAGGETRRGGHYPLLRNKSPKRWRRGGKIVENRTLRCKVQGKPGTSWGNASWSRLGTLELSSTCVQSNRLDSSWADLATSVGHQYHVRWPLPDVGSRWPRDDAMRYRYLHATGALNEAGAEPAGLAMRRGRAASWRGHPVPPEVLDLLPESLVREHLVVPVGGTGETLIVAAVDPDDIALADKLSFVTARRVRLVPAPREEIAAFLEEYSGPAGIESVDSMLQEFTDTAIDFDAGAPPPAAARRRPRGRGQPVRRRPGRARPAAGPTPCGRQTSPAASIRRIPWEVPGVFTYVVEEGQRVLMRRPNGTMDVIVGPRRVWRGRNTFQPMQHFVAHPGEYLIVRFRDGRQEHLPGPAEVWFDPRVHQEVDPRGGAPGRRQGGGRRLQQQGGHRHRPAADRVRPDAVHPAARRVAAHLRLARLRRRLAGRPQGAPRAGLPEALADARPDVPRRPRRPHRRRRRAHDPPDDLLRAARHRPDAGGDPRPDRRLRQRRHSATWSTSPAGTTSSRSSGTPTSSTSWRRTASSPAAAAQCGYRINKVVYRGYGAPERLQQMHDQAIEARTKLQLERATEQQAQDLEDFKLDSQLLRAGKRRHEQTAEVEHELELARKRQEAEPARPGGPAGLRPRSRPARRRAARAASAAERDARQREHLAALRDLGVDLTAYLTQGRADRVIELRGPQRGHPRPPRPGPGGRPDGSRDTLTGIRFDGPWAPRVVPGLGGPGPPRALRLGAAGPTGEDRGDPDRSLPIDTRRALDARPPSAMPSRADGSGSPPRSPGGPAPARRPSPRGWVPARAGPPGIPGDGPAGGWPYLLDISHPEWDRPGRPGTRRGPAPARGPSAGGPRPTPHGRGRPAAAEGGGWRGSVAACGRGGPAARPRRRPPRRRPGPPRRVLCYHGPTRRCRSSAEPGRQA